MSRYAFGVDVGGTTVKMGLFSEEGTLLDKWEIPTIIENNGEKILPDVADSIKLKMQEKNLSKEDIVGVGMGVPGDVDDEGNMIGGAVNLGWGEFPLTQVMTDYLDMPVKASNDANAAAFGEMWQGGGKGHRNLVFVTLGTGVGGGIIVNGEILAGAMGAGGEIGHMHVEDQETEPCGCKNKGCLEQYTSATGIVRLAKRRLAKDDAPSVLRQGTITAKAVWDAVKADDAVAKEIAETFGEYLGKGLAIIAAVVNPEVFVIGGGVSAAGEILIQYLKPYFDKYAFVSTRDVKFEMATIGNDAGIYGAAGLILR